MIGKHSEGIKLAEIGEALGRDWRGLIPITKELIGENKIRKEENLYYPVGLDKNSTNREKKNFIW